MPKALPTVAGQTLPRAQGCAGAAVGLNFSQEVHLVVDTNVSN